MLTDHAVLETLFRLGNQVAMLGWVILIFMPRRWRLLNLLPNLVLPIVLSLAYSVVIITVLSQSDGGGFSSLAAVKQLFSNDAVLLAGWLHYLAFDLFIGGWIARRSDQIGLNRIVQAPILLLTFILGPLGFFIFQFTYGSWRLVNQQKGLL